MYIHLENYYLMYMDNFLFCVTYYQCNIIKYTFEPCEWTVIKV